MTKEVIDLRSALELLESIPGQMVHTDVEVDPSAGTGWRLSLCGCRRHCCPSY